MSQRGPGSHSPPSHRHSQSPSTSIGPRTSQISLSIQPGQPYRHDYRVDSPRDTDNTSMTYGEEAPRQATPRPLGVHNILNPSEPRGAPDRTTAPTQHSGAGGDGSSSSNMGVRQYGMAGSPSQTSTPLHGQAPLYAQQELARMPTAVSMSTGPPLPVKQESPTPARPFPLPLGSARRILTARSPRSLSFSRSGTPGSLDPQYPPPPFPPYSTPRPGGQDDLPPFPVPAQAPPQQPPRTTAGPGPQTSPSALSAPLPRSYSQPSFANQPPFQFAQDPLQVGVAMRPQARPPPGYMPGNFGAAPLNRTFTPAGGPSGDGRLSSVLMNALQTGGSGPRTSDMQPMLALQYNTGEEMHIPVDVHQGSRQADEKRSRNAGASARHRARKKEQIKDQMNSVHRLESENRDLERQNQELQAERDFYRNERNRLRDIVLRTPSIRELAEQGPPSPASARGGGSLRGAGPGSVAGSFAESSPPAAASLSHSQAQAHPPPYASETSLERPTRRRRTDSAPEYMTPTSYSMAPTSLPPSTLPPINPQNYATGPNPANSSGTARLPPLRFDQQPASSPTTEHPPGGPPPLFSSQSQYSQYAGRAPHESGWATGPRGPQDPGQGSSRQ